MNETAICPHCERAGIVIRSQSWFSRGWPATCRECGALSYDRPHGIITIAGWCFETLGAPLLLFAYFVFPGIVTTVLFAAAALFLIYWGKQRGRPTPATRFCPISTEASQHSRYLTYIAIIITIAACIAIAIHRRS